MCNLGRSMNILICPLLFCFRGLALFNVLLVGMGSVSVRVTPFCLSGDSTLRFPVS